MKETEEAFQLIYYSVNPNNVPSIHIKMKNYLLLFVLTAQTAHEQAKFSGNKSVLMAKYSWLSRVNVTYPAIVYVYGQLSQPFHPIISHTSIHCKQQPLSS